jgi:hypothetical protein
MSRWRIADRGRRSVMMAYLVAAIAFVLWAPEGACELDEIVWP